MSVERLPRRSFQRRRVGRFLVNHKSLMRTVNLLTVLAFMTAFQISAVPAADSTGNPLLKESSLPLHYPAFDKIKNADFNPAMEAGMRDQLKEIEPIANNKA